ncbi:hypothetical protein EO244_04510 [Ancylomarina salipaludis]|uniref:SAM-dependent methyltransferase n=1 Tax=Ancylomarina salipaludis TaxID=2501299 RepID=A0A4V1N0B9_9BACT|nr:hypothetical protein [Ancylomarina salipaludis]RXQ96112.1 hypothetical protein EO244_04510 [Ancylomarina salipaludis]
MPHFKYHIQKRFTRLISRHYRGFGLDSPFVYHFVRNVIEAKMHYYPFRKLDRLCQNILSVLEGAISNKNLKEDENLWYVSEFNHLKDCTKLNRFIFRLVNFVNPKSLAFIGDDSGLNLIYLAKTDTRRDLYCMGARGFVHDFAHPILKEQALSNIVFSDLNTDLNFDFIQISRSVSSEVLLKFEQNLDKYLNEECYLIIENINRDEKMISLWDRLKKLDRFTVSLDLFDVGILIARKGLKKQEHNLSARAYK